MEEYILTQESFDRLWARVQGAVPAVSAPRTEDTLRRFLEETGETLLLERRLVGIIGAPMRALCRETERRRSRLQTAYYLQTEKRVPLPAVCCLREPPLLLLRKLCLGARARAEAYQDASGAVVDLRELYRDLAESEQLHAKKLEALIACFLG